MIALVMYRNPAEEFLWEYVYPYGAAIIIVAGVAFLLWWAIAAAWDKAASWWRNRK